MSLKNEYGRYMQAHELFPVLGYSRGAHLPSKGFEPCIVQHNGQVATFRCLPATPGRRKHRIEYWCEVCGIWMPYGRAGQHMKSKAHQV